MARRFAQWNVGSKDSAIVGTMMRPHSDIGAFHFRRRLWLDLCVANHLRTASSVISYAGLSSSKATFFSCLITS